MIHYRLIEEMRYNDDKTEYVAYGIAAFDERGCAVCASADITSVKEKALKLVELCERLQLSPIHLIEVVEDFIISDTY